jgi:hypothetical protein
MTDTRTRPPEGGFEREVERQEALCALLHHWDSSPSGSSATPGGRADRKVAAQTRRAALRTHRSGWPDVIRRQGLLSPG